MPDALGERPLDGEYDGGGAVAVARVIDGGDASGRLGLLADGLHGPAAATVSPPATTVAREEPARAVTSDRTSSDRAETTSSVPA